MHVPASLSLVGAAIVGVFFFVGCAALEMESTPQWTFTGDFEARRAERVVIVTDAPVPALRDSSVRHSVTRRVEDEASRLLIPKGYRLASRSDLDHVLSELTLQSSDWSAQDAVQVGRLMNVDAIVILSIVEYGHVREQRTFQQQGRPETVWVMTGVAEVNGRYIDVESGEALGVGSTRVQRGIDREGDVTGLVLEATRRLVGDFPSRHAPVLEETPGTGTP